MDIYLSELSSSFGHVVSVKFLKENIELHTVLEDWIELHDVIDKTGGDFSLYQAVVIKLLAEIPESRHWSPIFNRPLLDFSGGTPLCLTRGFWDAAVFRRKYGPRLRPKNDED